MGDINERIEKLKREAAALSSGKMMYRKTCQPFAPSILADSIGSVGMA